MQAVAVSEIIDSAVADTAELVQKAGFVLEKHIAPGLPHVLGDVTALSHCLQSLITNALKYGQKGRWIGINATCEQQPKTRHKKEVRISVSDHGDGIPRSEMPHIFVPFYRSPSVVASQIHGTGLGLPIAKSLAEAMNGSLSVTSEVGAGSVFVLCLRIAEELNEAKIRREGVVLQ
jgi:signal transduction histidine kinase